MFNFLCLEAIALQTWFVLEGRSLVGSNNFSRRDLVVSSEN
ncbi:MAG: hypothetical protein AAGJ08_00880 [Cyanobacteria bacterium P01_H01_bin.35]